MSVLRHFHVRTAAVVLAGGALVIGGFVVTGPAPATAAPATAASAASATATPTATPSVASAPTTPTTVATPSVTPTPSATTTTSPSDPSVSVMNANGDHTMGSSIPASQRLSTPKAAPMLVPQATVAGVSGMDVSGYQGNVDWQTAYNNGARFAYVKATEGTTYTSSSFSQQYSGSYGVGMTRGAYHYATPNTSSGATQARFFVSHGGGWSADGRTLPPLLDIEYGYNATCWGLSQSAMVSWIADFSNTVQSLTGVRPAIYSTTDWWSQCTGNSSQFSSNPLFIARYTSATSPGTLPLSWTTWSFWQYADSGAFPGDQDTFNGNAAALTVLADGGINGSAPVSVPAGPPVVGTTLTSGQSVVSPNGQYFVTMQSDGNVVLYGNGRAMWSTGTSGHPGAQFIAQGDGNAVIYSASGQPIWNTGTAGRGTAPIFEVLSTGDVTLVSTAGTTWQSIQPGADTLSAGATLKAGQFLHDSTYKWQFVMQSDGNLVVYNGGAATWSSRTSGYPGASVSLQADGNLVLYDSSGAARWSSQTSGRGSGTTLVMQGDGNAALLQGSTRIWDTSTGTAAAAPVAAAPSNTLLPGSQLAPGQSLVDSSGRMQLTMQSDGNLVLYQSGVARWATGTTSFPGSRLFLQTDGNLVLYDTSGVARWNSHTNNQGSGTVLVMQSDGNAVLYRGTTPLWYTGTAA